jgi:dipeptidyl aminopeptidase/acylaminoacyl peptidase
MSRLASAVLITFMTQAGAATASQRPLVPADLFQIEQFGEVIPSPDGKQIAFVRIRGKASTKFHMRDFMSGLDRADIWVVSVDGSEPKNVTHGAADGSGWFLPSWSPDGQRLAMLATRGDNVHLWVWERSSQKLKRISSSGVAISRPAWVSPEEVVCISLPKGERPGTFTMETGAAEKAVRAWPQAWRGVVPTVSVLRSGGTESTGGSTRQVCKFNVGSNATVVLLEGNASEVTISKDGRHVAALQAVGTRKFDPSQMLPNRNPIEYRLVVVGDPRINANDVVPGSLRWSYGAKIAFQARTNARPGDWMAAGGGNLTASFKTPPSTLLPIKDRDAFVGASDGRLWRIDAGSGQSRIIAPDFRGHIDSLRWSDGVTAVVDSGANLYSIDLGTEKLQELKRPAANAECKAFVPRTGLAVFSDETRSGTNLWLSGRKIASLNGFLATVSEAELKSIEYVGLNGQKLNGWVLLPANHVETNHPTVVWVYGGVTYSTVPPRFYVRLSDPGPFNLQLFAARGYAVILPSMPMQPEGHSSDPYRDLANGVLPAVDKAIDLGISDPKRLAVMGHSYGGYSVYSLVTQTSRFQAAVALAGFCDLISLYGTLDSRFRYDDDAREHLLHMVFSESGQFRMGVPPWKDMERYVRNSPITYAERVTTPLMIVQGDMDYVPIQQGEEFFTALYRQNKAASFVRYWGEGHIIESPANVSDLWTRIYAWLAQFVG